MLQNFFNLVDWDPTSYVYSRATLDSRPYQLVRKNDKSSIVFNALGIKKDDINIEIERQGGRDFLVISGETKNEVLNKTYSVSGKFGVNSDEINEIEWTTEDGLLFIDILFKKPEKPKINIRNK